MALLGPRCLIRVLECPKELPKVNLKEHSASFVYIQGTYTSQASLAPKKNCLFCYFGKKTLTTISHLQAWCSQYSILQPLKFNLNYSYFSCFTPIRTDAFALTQKPFLAARDLFRNLNISSVSPEAPLIQHSKSCLVGCSVLLFLV